MWCYYYFLLWQRFTSVIFVAQIYPVIIHFFYSIRFETRTPWFNVFFFFYSNTIKSIILKICTFMLRYSHLYGPCKRCEKLSRGWLMLYRTSSGPVSNLVARINWCLRCRQVQLHELHQSFTTRKTIKERWLALKKYSQICLLFLTILFDPSFQMRERNSDQEAGNLCEIMKEWTREKKSA